MTQLPLPHSRNSTPSSPGSRILRSNASSPAPEGPALPSASREVPVKKGRKGHTKSRAGCKTCKKRKVKCDEVKPECGNCIRFGVPCDFQPSRAQSSASSRTPRTTGRGRPRKDWDSWSRRLNSLEPPSESSPASQPSTGESLSSSAQPSLPTLNVEDLELLHHYCTSTAMTAGDTTIWRDNAPQLGYEHPCVLHAMLALSAHHLARSRPLRAPRYLVSADRHYEMAVKGATRMLPHLGVDNCQALYVVTVIVCFTAFAKGPAPGDLLVVAGAGRVPWLALLRGVRIVLGTIGTDVVLSGILEPKPENEQPPAPPRDASRRYPPFHWEASLQRLGEFIRTTAAPESWAAYEGWVGNLAPLFQETFGAAEAPKEDATGEFPHIMAWIYRIDDGFVEALEAKEPVALLTMGHFAILLRTLEHYWFIEGWGSHILREVKKMLGPAFEGWLP